MYPVWIGAEPQQAENSHFHNDGNGSFRAYVKHMHCLLLLYQTLITWMISALALESDSMRSRSSLLRGRTAFSIYRFDNRDRAFVIALFNCITLTAMGVILGASKMWYNPRIIWQPLAGRLRGACTWNAHFLRLGNPRRCAGPCGNCGKGGEWNGLYCGGQFKEYVPAEAVFPGEWCDSGVWDACGLNLAFHHLCPVIQPNYWAHSSIAYQVFYKLSLRRHNPL